MPFLLDMDLLFMFLKLFFSCFCSFWTSMMPKDLESCLLQNS